MKLKKIIFLNLCLAIFACDSDTSENTPPPIPDPSPTGDSVLLKKTIETDSEGVFTTLYNYDGNKLTSVVTEVSYDDYITETTLTYDDNDFLVKCVNTSQDDDQGDHESITDLEYTNGKLSKITEMWETIIKIRGIVDGEIIVIDSYTNYYINVYEITHNNDNTLSVTINRTWIGKDDETSTSTYNELWTFQNENLIEISSTEGDELYTYKGITKYEYDNKNNAFKNIHAIDVLNILAETEGGAFILGNTNNHTFYSLLSESTYVPDNLTESIYEEETFLYTYNANGFPIEASNTGKSMRNGEVDDIFETSTIKYFYE